MYSKVKIIKDGEMVESLACDSVEWHKHISNAKNYAPCIILLCTENDEIFQTIRIEKD